MFTILRPDPPPPPPIPVSEPPFDLEVIAHRVLGKVKNRISSEITRATDENAIRRHVTGNVPGFLAVLLLTETNRRGACLVILAGIAAFLADVYADLLGIDFLPKQIGRLLLVFGLVAYVTDLVSRRFSRCQLPDVVQGSKFMSMPVWGLGLIALLSGILITAASGHPLLDPGDVPLIPNR